MEKLSDDVKTELLKRKEKEQDMRRVWSDKDDPEIEAQVLALDTENTEFLKNLVERFGWPKISDVGEDLAEAAWLIAQHSPDLEFMSHCLELMQEDPDEVDPQHLARTIDRIRISRNHQLQYYGTHFNKLPGGNYAPLPIEDAEHVNERRTAMGMETIEEATAWYNSPKSS
jgi:hypothetical protein